MTKGSESSTCCPANPVMSASPPATIVDSSKQCSTATALEFLGATCRKRFGDWKSTHKRLSRWAKKGAWQRLFEHLAAEADNEYAMIDSTIVRAHQHRAGAPKKDDDQAIGRSKGGLSTKIHALVDGLGNPLRFLLTPGQADDLIGADALLPQMAAEVLISDKAYDADEGVLKPLASTGKSFVIPPRQNRTTPRQFDEAL